MKRNVVIDECQIFVRPSNAFILTPEQVAQTGVTQEDLMKGFSLLEAVQKFNDHCYYNYTSHNKSFCLATCGDITLTLVIPNEVVNLGIKLPQHFF
jgi:DNA polymerase III alpha subunit (gram-positive type)